jgi:hypothetical protein
MGRVQDLTYSNSGEVKCGTRLEKGINIAMHCENGYGVTEVPANRVTHMSF